ncbi:MAG: M15 family metallopeptidase [Acetatifactor sp.]|nr:M15 family metallopeptidase [Acetatifactor sp.]
MKITVEEQIRYRLLKMGKKGPLRRILAITGIYIFLAALHFVRYIHNNKKRLAMVMMSMVLFVAYASFSFPIFTDGEESKMDDELVALLSDETVSLVQEEEIHMEDLDSWEDELDWEEEEAASLLEEDPEEDQINLEDILSYRREQEGYEDSAAVQPERQAEGDTEFSLDDWRLILVNKQHPIPEDYDFTLATIKGSQRCDERIIDDLLAMMQAAKEAGFTLVIKSPYRSDARQEFLFDRKIKLYMGKGMSYMDAFKLSSQVVMVPDSSEHQIGLSLDIVCDYYETLTQGFGDTEAGIWMEEHCAEFGFIVRYPKGKEYITSVEYEPWHFRYVGVEAATIIMEQELTLEEFVKGLK